MRKATAFTEWYFTYIPRKIRVFLKVWKWRFIHAFGRIVCVFRGHRESTAIGCPGFRPFTICGRCAKILLPPRPLTEEEKNEAHSWGMIDEDER